MSASGKPGLIWSNSGKYRLKVVAVAEVALGCATTALSSSLAIRGHKQSNNDVFRYYSRL